MHFKLCHQKTRLYPSLKNSQKKNKIENGRLPYLIKHKQYIVTLRISLLPYHIHTAPCVGPPPSFSLPFSPTPAGCAHRSLCRLLASLAPFCCHTRAHKLPFRLLADQRGSFSSATLALLEPSIARYFLSIARFTSVRTFLPAFRVLYGFFLTFAFNNCRSQTC